MNCSRRFEPGLLTNNSNIEMSLLGTLVELGFSQNEAQEYSDLFQSHDITQNELMSLDHELLKVLIYTSF
jgi:ribosomal protein S2